jgi:integrase
MKYEQVCRDWLAFLDRRADKPLEMVRKVDALAFQDGLTKCGLAPRTVNETLKILRSIHEEAVEQGHTGRNPFAGVDPVRDDDDDARRVPFTRAEVASLLRTAEGDWKGFVTLAATTGLRLMDASRLQWKNLDTSAGMIRVKTAKTGATLHLPIHTSFSEWLRTQPRGIGAAPVFPSLAGKKGAGKTGLSAAFKRLMKRADISSGLAREAGGRGRNTSQKSFHSLRHFAATQLAESGIRAEIARAITGHADADTHAGYITADVDALWFAVNTIKLSA